jgi:antitoxin (DNA-binding transcriptional repressor) of toxin-antitoxin stability system
MMNRISATHAARNFSDLINRVRYQSASFEIARGNEVIARIIPAAPSITLSIADLDEQLAQLPRLDAEDAGLFEASLDDIRQNATLPESLWD